MLTRNEKLLHCIDVAKQVGAEIGPLDRPVVTRRMGQIRYVDHDTTEALWIKYADPANHVDTSKIVEVDYVWGEKSLSDLLQGEAPIDYVIASHVIEHVPDFIGWLNEVKAILKPGGILSLAIPDKRRCFDYHRQLTKTADVVEAYLRNSKTPSPRQIFDHLSSAVTFGGNIAWDRSVDATQLVHCHSTAEAWVTAKNSFTTGDYCDVHCWVFTPISFLKLLSDLTDLDLLKFEVVQFYVTEGCEFFVSLRATDQPDRAKVDDFAASLMGEDSALMVESEEVQELKSVQQQIRAMESSKFWKMRTAWFKVKRKLGLPSR
ncbi:MAG: class I SAM-dependent methyltransferase [Phormidesmis sp. CAN_BIN44]|nr:class I SAM-dependent methyltransferase [Phormidesmis sp. CAN_BIN44]